MIRERKLPIWNIVVLEESKKPEKKLISYVNETLLLIIQEIRRFERAYISCSIDNVITSGCMVFFFCVNYRQKKHFNDRNSIAYLF